jgi:UvrD/REP helicase N-terminal domain
MTSTTNSNGSGVAPITELVVVHVRDAINSTLAGRGDASYQSPQQTREDALPGAAAAGLQRSTECQRASLEVPDRGRLADGHAHARTQRRRARCLRLSPDLTPPRRAPTCRLSAGTTNFSLKEACLTKADPGLRNHAPPGTERLLAGLTPEQAQAVTHGTGPLLLLAGPGAGKTRTLTHRAAYLLASGRAQPWEILAVTFSVRAAGELRLRLADLLGETVARGVTAATFHSVCARLLREHAGVFGRTEALHDLRPGGHAPRDRLAALRRRARGDPARAG